MIQAKKNRYSMKKRGLPFISHSFFLVLRGTWQKVLTPEEAVSLHENNYDILFQGFQQISIKQNKHPR